MRNRGIRRHNDWVKAIRKQKLYRYYMGYCTDEDLYDNLHQYSKNKIPKNSEVLRHVKTEGSKT